MSRALVCDNCGVTLGPLDKNGEHESGEDAAWVQVSARGLNEWLDACTRSCAVELIESGPFADAVDAQAEVISSIARAVRDDRAADDDEAAS